MTSKELSDAMTLYRAKHRLSQTEFAKKCGLTVQTVCSIETEQQSPSRVTLAKIMLVLDSDKEE